jgi:CubicO group peptidase (beta-lactamase class C family)
MKRTLLLLTVLVISQGTFGQSKTENSLKDAIGLIDAWLESQQAYDHLPGISAGIVKNQQLIWNKQYGFADLRKNVPTTSETVYSICSISKLFTAIAIMQLQEAGKLKLDDDVSDILPHFNVQQQFKESGPITIRSLLTHSSGLPRESDYPYWSGPDFTFPTIEKVNEKMGAQKTLYPASTYFQYSNLGITLLGEVIEKISGKPYEVYVEENILKPMKLGNTHPFMPKGQTGDKLATGYSSIKRDGTREIIPRYDARGLNAAAGYSSTMEDLAHFSSWQFRLLENGGKEILSAATLKEMQRVHWVDPDWKIHWGLGFAIHQNNGKTLVGHSGNCPGYRTTMILEPTEKFAYIVMINANVNPWKYASQIRYILQKGQGEQNSKPEVNLQAYTGLYNAQPWGSEKKVIQWYGNLAILDLPSENPLEDMTLLQHEKDDTFRRIRRDENLGEQITFERDKDGKVTRMWQNSNYSMKLN